VFVSRKTNNVLSQSLKNVHIYSNTEERSLWNCHVIIDAESLAMLPVHKLQGSDQTAHYCSAYEKEYKKNT